MRCRTALGHRERRDAGSPRRGGASARHGATGISTGCSSRPASLLILALSIYPLLFSVWVAFVNYDFQIPGHAFVGLQNFEQVIADPVARCSLCRHRRRSSASSVAVEFVLGLALALAMAQQLPRARR